MIDLHRAVESFEMVFHPKEEERDAFWLKISFSAMFSIALILTIYSSYLPGVKYLLLSQFGATSTADIVRLDHATVSHEQFLAFEQGELSEDELTALLKKAGPNAKYFHLTVEFKPLEGAPTKGNYPPPICGCGFRLAGFGVWPGMG